MKDCCEKWKEWASIAWTWHDIRNVKFCPECGERLEENVACTEEIKKVGSREIRILKPKSEWCGCEEPDECPCSGGKHKPYCIECHKLIKPKSEWCECGEPYFCDSDVIDSEHTKCRKCNKLRSFSNYKNKCVEPK